MDGAPGSGYPSSMSFLRVAEAIGACVGAALAGCGGVTAAAPSDGGAEGSAADVAAGIVDAGAVADRVAPTDAAPGEVQPAEGGCGVDSIQVQSPSFSPPDGTTFCSPGGQVVIEPPPGVPGVSIFYTTNGSVPWCPGPATNCTGTPYTGPVSIADIGSTTLWAVAVSECLAPSPLASATYLVADCGTSGPPAPFPNPTSSTWTHPILVSIQSSPGATICYTLDGSTPTCTATGTCSGTSRTYDPTKGIVVDGTVTDPVTQPPTGKVTLEAIECDSSGDVSVVTTAQYQLVMAPPYLASTNADGEGQPGWNWSGDGGAAASMTLPADAGAPYGPFVAQQVGAQPCTSATACTGTANALADFLCWDKATTTSCSCASPIPLTAASPSATLPASADVSPGDSLSVVACAKGYAASTVTTVQFQ